MKRFILTTAVALSAATYISASDYVPMIREGRVWEYQGSYFIQDEYGVIFHRMKFDGSVVFNEKEYHCFRLYESTLINSDTGERRTEKRDGPVFLLREEPGKVYALCHDEYIVKSYCGSDVVPTLDGDKSLYEDFLIYDFKAEEGQTVNVPCGEYVQAAVPMQAEWATPKVIDGEECGVLRYSFSGMPEDNIKYIEGIGVTANGCLPVFEPMFTPSIFDDSYEYPQRHSILNAVYDSAGETIYDYMGSDYMPMIEQGKVWEYRGSYSRQADGRNEAGIVSHFMKFEGTADVNGKTYSCFTLYKSEYYRGTDVYGELELAETKDCDGPRYFMREEGEKVYILTYEDRIFGTDKSIEECFGGTESPEGYGEFLRYDFGLADGDSFNLPSGVMVSSDDLIPVTVKIEGPVMVGEYECNAMTFTGENGIADYPGTVIEGIGPTEDGDLAVFGPPYLADTPDNSLLPGQGSSLVRVYGSDGNLVYGKEPGGVSSVADNTVSDDTIYDVLGRRVSSTAPGSVYIRGGKKFVAK